MPRHLPSTAPTLRRGMAPVEFCMALPILLVLMVGITWLGFSVIAQTEVLVEARNNAWKRRFEDASKQPLIFPAGLVVADNPLYPRNTDYITESATKAVDVSPVFSAMPAPNATHTILAGSWDHRAMDMNSPPNLGLYARAAGNAVTGDIQTRLGNLTNLFNSVQQSGASAIAQAVTRGNDAQRRGSQSESQARAGDSESKRKKEEEQAQLIAQYRELGGRIEPWGPQTGEVTAVRGKMRQAKDEQDRLEREYAQKSRQSNSDEDDQQKEQREKELAALERQIELTKIKYERLKTEFLDVVAELEASGMNRFQISQL